MPVLNLISLRKFDWNYHIFDELLAGASDEEMDKCFLGGSVIEDYQLTSMSETFDRRDGVEDYKTYGELGEGQYEVETNDHFCLLIAIVLLAEKH